MRLLSLPGVFAPISDSCALAEGVRCARIAPGSAVLDLCTGSGMLAIVAARRGAQVTAVDASWRAVWTVRINARLNGVRVRALRGDLFGPVADERFDLIVSNPPYVPSHGDELPRRGRARAWDAGRDGRILLDRILEQAPGRLKPGGEILVVHSSVIGEARTLERLRDAGLSAEVLIRRRGPLGPLLSGRAAELEARGLLTPGQREEDVLVIRGRSQAPTSAKSGVNDHAAVAKSASHVVRSLQTRS